MQDSSNKLPLKKSKPSAELLGRLADAPSTQFLISARGEVQFNDTIVASLVPGASLFRPNVRLQIQAPSLAEQIERVIREKVACLFGDFSVQESATLNRGGALLADLSQRLHENLGSLRLQHVQGLVKAIRGQELSRMKASSLVLGRRHVYLPESLNPSAVLTRLALLSVHKKIIVPEHCKPAQVLILDQQSGLSHLSGTDFERLGYERFAGRALRVDIVERVLHPTFGQKLPSHLPSLMHMFRCSEDEAKLIAKQLKLGKAPEKRGPKTNHSDEGRTRSGRNRSGGRKSLFRS